MTRTPPTWMWNWQLQVDEDEEERLEDEEPASVEQKKLKEVFDTAAGARHMDAAYHPAYVLARRLVRFAIFGIPSSEAITIAQTMLGEWESLLHKGVCMETGSP